MVQGIGFNSDAVLMLYNVLEHITSTAELFSCIYTRRIASLCSSMDLN